MKKRNTFMMGILLSACWLMAGCSTIDDDLSECGPEEEDFELNYELKLVTNLTTELETQLRTLTEFKVKGALETHLEKIFTDKAHDVDLSFYDTEGTKEVLEHVTDVIDANQTTYDLTLPMRQYLHLAVANIAENPVVGLAGEKYSYSSELRQAAPTVSDGFPGHLPHYGTLYRPSAHGGARGRKPGIQCPPVYGKQCRFAGARHQGSKLY